MRLIGIGLAAALALVALAPAAQAAEKSPPIDKAARAQGMKEAPAIVQAVGVACTVSDARFIGKGADAKTKAVATYYEVACQEGFGLVVGGVANAPVAIGCLDVSAPGADGKPNGLRCLLPANTNPAASLAVFFAKQGKPCVVEKGRYIGGNATITVYEAACQGGAGYVVEAASPPDPSKKADIIPCYAIPTGNNMACTLSNPTAQLTVADTLIGQSGKGCSVTNRRFVAELQDHSEMFEVACGDGKGWMVQRTAAGALGLVVDCGGADRIAGGCTLTDARAAQTEQASLYTRLAKKAGYDCDVEKYGPMGGSGDEEIVELQCKNRPDGGIAVFKGSGGVVYDCARSELFGYRCSFTRPDADNDHLTADLKSLGKTQCVVSSSRVIGTSGEGAGKHGYVEVACADGLPGWVVEYAIAPSTPVVPASVLTCGQAASFTGGCKLPGNPKK